MNIRPKTICSIPMCGKEHVARGYCQRHYWQIIKLGKILERTVHDRNEVFFEGNIAHIFLYGRDNIKKHEVIIDIKDYEKVANYKWHLCKGQNTYYAKANTQINGKWTKNSISHVIMTPETGIKVDHIDGNGLNNLRENLRFCSHGQNAMNSQKRTGTVSSFRGVCLDKNTKKWVSKIQIEKETKHLGCFTDEIKAALAYNQAAIQYHGEFARLNEISCT